MIGTYSTGGKLVCIKGAGDVASAVAHRLFTEGYSVALIESSAPTAPRRRMSFVQAVFDSEAELENVRAVRVGSVIALMQILEEHEAIPLIVGDLVPSFELPKADILVDARMRKKERPEIQIHEAPFTIGLGPNFHAGITTHVVIETNWGEHLGQVIYQGESESYTGQPREVAGVARGRYTYAACDGTWRTSLEIGQRITAGKILGSVGPVVMHAEITGIVRGVTKDGLTVSAGTKIVDVDPRGDERFISGISERPRRIAEGVLQAVREWEASHPEFVRQRK